MGMRVQTCLGNESPKKHYENNIDMTLGQGPTCLPSMLRTPEHNNSTYMAVRQNILLNFLSTIQISLQI